MLALLIIMLAVLIIMFTMLIIMFAILIVTVTLPIVTVTTLTVTVTIVVCPPSFHPLNFTPKHCVYRASGVKESPSHSISILLTRKEVKE